MSIVFCDTVITIPSEPVKPTAPLNPFNVVKMGTTPPQTDVTFVEPYAITFPTERTILGKLALPLTVRYPGIITLPGYDAAI
jgi:hypothetical protein